MEFWMRETNRLQSLFFSQSFFLTFVFLSGPTYSITSRYFLLFFLQYSLCITMGLERSPYWEALTPIGRGSFKTFTE